MDDPTLSHDSEALHSNKFHFFLSEMEIREELQRAISLRGAGL